jgi:hypothetical protein
MSELADLLRQGSLTAKEIMAQIGVSQATLSRRLAEHNDVRKIGRGKATRYALLRPIEGESEFPLYRIDTQGHAELVGVIVAIWPAESCAFETADGLCVLFDGLPWFITDMRPQGFLGRAWGRDVSGLLALPEDIKLWNESQTLLALSRYGNETVGDLIVGQAAYQQWALKPDEAAVALQNKISTFEKLAQKSLAGQEVGSSAGGEQPKFSVFVEHQQKSASTVLVKFSPQDANENTRRWGDLLRAEAHALAVLHQAGIAAAQAEVYTGSHGEVFLQVERFDRLGERGRRGLASLEAVAAEFTGGHGSWVVIAEKLQQEKLLSQSTLVRIGELYAFGKLIANGDMHQGNLSFIDPPLLPNKFAFALSPVYDMLPMSFAPDRSGNMKRQAINIVLDPAVSKAQWLGAQRWALDFWRRVEEDELISPEFRLIASQMLAQVKALTATIRRLA